MLQVILLSLMILQFQSAIIIVPLSYQNTTSANISSSNDTVNASVIINSSQTSNNTVDTTNISSNVSTPDTKTTITVNIANLTNTTPTQNISYSYQNTSSNQNYKSSNTQSNSQEYSSKLNPLNNNGQKNKNSKRPPLPINLLQNSDFQFDKLPLQIKSTTAFGWNLIESYLINGAKVSPKWPTKIGLLGMQCLSEIVRSLPRNRRSNIISQAITLKKAQRLTLTFTYGLVSLASTAPVTPSISNRILWVSFNQKISAVYVNSKIRTFTMQVNGVIGKNTLNFHGLSAEFGCNGNEFIAIDNVMVQTN